MSRSSPAICSKPWRNSMGIAIFDNDGRAPIAWKHEIIPIARLPEDSNRRSAQRHAVRAVRLHSFGGNRPNARPDIDLTPSRTDDFARPGRRQDGERQGSRGDSGLSRQARHEGRKLRERHGGMMPDAPDHSVRRKKLIEMTFPSGRVLALPEFTHPRRIEIFATFLRTRFAVSGLLDQIGSKARITSAVSTAATGSLPKIGEA
jgi:hypothetical protein